jgi:LasA protease
MNVKLTQKTPPRNLLQKLHPSLIMLSCILAIFLISALACNLPSRQLDGLTFPTEQRLPTPSGLPFPTTQAASPTPAPEVPTSPPGSVAPPQPTYPFLGLQTATPGLSLPGTWITPELSVTLQPYVYWTQPGDTLTALAAHFGVSPDQISPSQPLTGLLMLEQQLNIPNVLGEPAYPSVALPDSAIVYSPEAASFSISDYIYQADGYLSTYREEVDKEKHEWLTGYQIVQRVAENTSVNPKVLLAFLEFRSGWVRGQPFSPEQKDYPLGFYVPEYKGLYLELSLVAKELNIGYYGWREGTLTELVFPGSTRVRVTPSLNAGSVAVQNLSSKFYRQQQDWVESLYGPKGFLAVYNAMFGDPWQSAASVEPLYTPNLAQPTLELPFAPGTAWSLTAGPHIAWNTGTPRGALDFSPIILLPPCAPSPAWVTASAPGLVVRTGDGLVVLDLDGDGLEQTGWVLIYMHVAEQDRVTSGTWVEKDAPLGHPSCEGGRATGTNLHLARKYNGEWMAADGPVPMVLSGWVAHNSEVSYEGTLEKDGLVVSARPDGSSGSTITR